MTELQTKVGDKTVSEQISAAIAGITYPVTSVNGKAGDVALSASDVDALPITGGELTGILYTSASTPLFISKNGKVGMRAATADNNNVGQINVSNSWYPDGDQWGAQMSVLNGKTGKRNGFRVSHNGMEYEDENEVVHQVLHDGNISEYADASGSANAALDSAKSYIDSEIAEWVGDTKVSEQISAAINPLSSEIANKANASHGNHVPATQTADNATFLRNDNTWQKVTPANIGASATGHKHTKSEITDFPTSMTPTAHNQAASTITAGTFAGQVVANSSGQTYSTYCLRNTRLASSDTNPTVNGQICWTYK